MVVFVWVWPSTPQQGKLMLKDSRMVIDFSNRLGSKEPYQCSKSNTQASLVVHECITNHQTATGSPTLSGSHSLTRVWLHVIGNLWVELFT